MVFVEFIDVQKTKVFWVQKPRSVLGQDVFRYQEKKNQQEIGELLPIRFPRFAIWGSPLIVTRKSIINVLRHYAGQATVSVVEKSFRWPL